MRTQNVSHTLVLGLAVALTLSCGDDEGGTKAPGPALKDGAHLLPNPETGFVVFPLTQVNDESSFTVTLYSGGKEAVTLNEICLELPGQALAENYEPCAAPVTDSAFSLTVPESDQVASGALAAVGVTFAPSERGVSVLRLVVANTSDNLPALSFELVGPGAAFPLPTGPDIAAFESTVSFALDAGSTSGLGFVRYYNLGGGLLNVSNYTVSGEGFALLDGVLTPSEVCDEYVCGDETLPSVCEPVSVGTGAFRVLGLSAGASATTGEFVIKSNDPDTCELTLSLAVE